MPSRTWISGLHFTPAQRADTERGLLGWLAFDIDGTWHVDGVALRRTGRGRLALSFPARIDRGGREHPILRPTCDRARRAIERAVLAELGLHSSPLPAAPEEPHQVLRPAPRGAHVDAAVPGHDPEQPPSELGFGKGQGGQRTGRGRVR